MKKALDSGMKEWYHLTTGKYNGVYFPCDGQTEEASFDDDDLEVMN